MAALKAVFRWYSYLFHAVLTLFLMAISGLAMASGMANLHLGMLPWKGETLIRYVFFGSLIGLITVLLAMRGILRFLFLIWALVVLYFLVKGYWLSNYRFEGMEYKNALWLTGGALLAIPGALQLRGRSKGRKRPSR